MVKLSLLKYIHSQLRKILVGKPHIGYFILVTNIELPIISVLVIRYNVNSFSKLNLFVCFSIVHVDLVIFDEKSLTSVDQKLGAIVIKASQDLLVLGFLFYRF